MVMLQLESWGLSPVIDKTILAGEACVYFVRFVSFVCYRCFQIRGCVPSCCMDGLLLLNINASQKTESDSSCCKPMKQLASELQWHSSIKNHYKI